MKRSPRSLWQPSVTGLAAALVCGTIGSAQEDVLIPSAPIPYTVRLLADQPPVPASSDVLVALVNANENEDESKKDSREASYWLGVQVAQLPDLAKKQLGVERGLAVGDVVADSPAAKAGIERHDILTKVNDASLSELADLVKAVEASDGKEMTIALLRAGKEKTVRATATKAATAGRTEVPTLRPELAAEIRRVEETLKKLRAEAGDQGFNFFFPRPAYVPSRVDPKLWQGVIEAKGAKPALPNDVSVRISKEGDQPGKIHVKKGDKEWNVSEDKLSELPDDLRPHIERMIGKGLPVRIRAAAPAKGERTVRVSPDGKVEGEIHLGPVIAVAPVPPVPPTAPVAPAPATRVSPEKATRAFSYRTERGALDEEGTLSAILKELRDLRKEVDDLRKTNKD